MSESIASLGSAADSTYGHGQPSNTPAETPETSTPDPSDASDTTDLRLMIEADQADGALIYTTVDGRTGKVVQKLPREQVLRMGDAKNYVAGQLIKTRI
jgi:uncharacterized FlaG/YvyC family protein